MANSLLSRRFLSGRLRLLSPSLRLFSTTSSSDSDTVTSPDHATFTSPDPTSSRPVRPFEPGQPREIEGGMDPGLFKAILVGKVGQAPMKRRLRGGMEIVLFSLATGGIRNNRRPLAHERPEEYESRCSVQWHRVSVYPDRLVTIAMNIVKPGAVLYLEGNIETKVYSDPVTGIVRRIREISVRGDGGRILYLGSDDEAPKLDEGRARAVGYF
ncbi:single-stranded DNA-binding protein [Carex littledalei]|uniref:Single-stranded DNA-binding protein n=1 Tax=Carex littledalei TaxID=544730 RepID=A0A833RJ14_9POAL|nr:single-stranded DNA-binding protein [Carex littledalei]